MGHTIDKRIDDAHNENASASKSDGSRKADASVDITENIAVIPPVSME